MSSAFNQDPAPKEDESSAKTVGSAIAEHPFLSGLQPEHLRILARNAMKVHYDPGELIFREGDPANRFYLIEKGRVLLEWQGKNQTAIAVETLGPGDVLGWSWLFPPYYWHFDARVLEPTTAMFFYGTRLRAECEQDHSFGYEMMKRMSHVVIQRLQATRKQWLLRARE